MRRIVLIDDDSTTNYLNKMIIERTKIVDEVLSFDGGNDALDYFKGKINEEEEALVFLDINMPEMNGWEFLEEFITLNGKLDASKVILLTSSINPNDKQMAEDNSRVTALKSKPLSAQMLDELVNDYFQ